MTTKDENNWMIFYVYVSKGKIPGLSLKKHQKLCSSFRMELEFELELELSLKICYNSNIHFKLNI